MFKTKISRGAIDLIAMIVVFLLMTLALVTLCPSQMVRYGGYTYRTNGPYLVHYGPNHCDMCRLGAYFNMLVDQQASAQQLAAARRAAETAGTPLPVVQQLLPLLHLDESLELLDVGCGDGRILIAAAKKYGCRGTGVEIDTQLANQAAAKVRKDNLPIQIFHGDAREYNGFAGRVVYCYLFPDLLKELQPKLSQALRVVTYMHAVPGMEGSRHLIRVDGKYLPVYVWKAPKLAIPVSVPPLRSK